VFKLKAIVSYDRCKPRIMTRRGTSCLVSLSDNCINKQDLQLSRDYLTCKDAWKDCGTSRFQTWCHAEDPLVTRSQCFQRIRSYWGPSQ